MDALMWRSRKDVDHQWKERHTGVSLQDVHALYTFLPDKHIKFFSRWHAPLLVLTKKHFLCTNSCGCPTAADMEQLLRGADDQAQQSLVDKKQAQQDSSSLQGDLALCKDQLQAAQIELAEGKVALKGRENSLHTVSAELQQAKNELQVAMDELLRAEDEYKKVKEELQRQKEEVPEAKVSLQRSMERLAGLRVGQR